MKYENKTLYLSSWLKLNAPIQDTTIKILLNQLGYSEIYVGKLKQSLIDLKEIGAISISKDITNLKMNDIFTITVNKSHEIFSLSNLDRNILEKISDCDFLRKDNLFCVTKCYHDLIENNSINRKTLLSKQIKELTNLSHGSVINCLFYIEERGIL